MEQFQSNIDSCPTAPPHRLTVYIKVLHRACQKLGGVEELARTLRVSPQRLIEWLEGAAEPPSSIFLKAVDVVMPPWGSEEDEALRAYSEKRRRQPLIE